MRTYAKIRAAAGFVPSSSFYTVCTTNSRRSTVISEAAQDHYKSLLSAGFPAHLKGLYNGVSRYFGDDVVSLLDFKTDREFDVFSQTPEKYVEGESGLTLLEDVYSFLRWDGSFISAGDDGFSAQRYVVRQRTLSCATSLAECGRDDLTILSGGETVKQAFDTVIHSRGWRIFGVLFEQRSHDRLLSAILYFSGGHKSVFSPYG